MTLVFTNKKMKGNRLGRKRIDWARNFCPMPNDVKKKSNTFMLKKKHPLLFFPSL